MYDAFLSRRPRPSSCSDAFGNPALPFTIDETRNGYSHFWDDHLIVHDLEAIRDQYGVGPCEQVASSLGLAVDCSQPFPHPTTRQRLDYVLVRQGSDFQVVVEDVDLEDTPRTTEMCRDVFPMADHAGMECYLSDHYGLSGRLKLVRE